MSNSFHKQRVREKLKEEKDVTTGCFIFVFLVVGWLFGLGYLLWKFIYYLMIKFG
jgi:hypothetical protein